MQEKEPINEFLNNINKNNNQIINNMPNIIIDKNDVKKNEDKMGTNIFFQNILKHQ